MANESLMALYRETLKDLYDAEHQILEALPKMADKTGHTDLKTAFKEHEQVTRRQVDRLERIFAELGQKAERKACKGMRGLIAEGDEAMKEHDDSDVRDAALIGGAQKVEHYEIAGYGCARTYAAMLGFEKQADMLQETLDEEGDADKELTQLAETVINVDALKA
jgi:ferritin-like metal-binding protein YciE